MTDTQLEALADRMAANMPADQGDAVDYILDALKSVQNSLPVSPAPPLVEPADAANRESAAVILELQQLGKWVRDMHYNRDDAPDEIARAIENRIRQLKAALPICGTNAERKGSEGLPDLGLSFDQKEAKQEFE